MVKDLGNGVKGSTLDDAVPRVSAVSGDVADSPNDLLNHFDVWRLKQLDEVAQHVLLYQIVDVVRGARRHIGQAPGSLELELGDFVVEELDEDVDEVGVDHLLDGGNVLDRKQLPHSDQSEKLNLRVLVEEQALELVELVDLELHLVSNCDDELLELDLA